MSSSEAEQVGRIVDFLRGIGLPVRETELAGKTFMPGVSIGGGALLYDAGRLTYPGDLLHEAGHMAVLLPAEREACDGDVGGDPAGEMGAIAWSYAAAMALGLDARVVFHADGYAKGGHTVAANFEAGRYLGTPLLQWYGMTVDPNPGQPRDGEFCYPRMRRWLREEPAS